jgi:hypothetical protein
MSLKLCEVLSTSSTASSHHREAMMLSTITPISLDVLGEYPAPVAEFVVKSSNMPPNSALSILYQKSFIIILAKLILIYFVIFE